MPVAAIATTGKQCHFGQIMARTQHQDTLGVAWHNWYQLLTTRTFGQACLSTNLTSTSETRGVSKAHCANMHKCSVCRHRMVVEHHCEPTQLVDRRSTTSAIDPAYGATILPTERQHIKRTCNLILQRSMLRTEEQTPQGLLLKSSTTICMATSRSNSHWANGGMLRCKHGCQGPSTLLRCLTYGKVLIKTTCKAWKRIDRPTAHTIPKRRSPTHISVYGWVKICGVL